jgi:glyoxylase-like metal-dependent hydrolase (beta-lactamase superfamily II)
VAAGAAAARGLRVRFLLCTHAHADHFNRETLRRMRDHFPDATPVLHAGFVGPGVRIDHDEWLAVGGEPLALVPAPKHSLTDTLVVWRGTCCTGDWELGTLAGVHDGNPGAVPADRKRASLREMAGWEGRFDYRIRGVYSAHANDRREHLDFAALMRQTLAG